MDQNPQRRHDQKILRPIYYKASGHWAPYGLISLYLATASGAFVLCLISHLFWMRWPEARGSSFLVVTIWYWLTALMAKYAVKMFKVRNRGLAFLMALIGVATGWLMTWVIFWIMGQEAVGFIDFVKEHISRPRLAQAFLHFGPSPKLAIIKGGPWALWLMAWLYAFIPACTAMFQANKPFNECDKRWFQKKTLPTITFIGKDANITERLLIDCKIEEFVLHDNYKIVRYLPYWFPIIYINGAITTWFYYDRDLPEVYLVIRYSQVGRFWLQVNQVQITRRQANLLYRKIVLGQTFE